VVEWFLRTAFLVVDEFLTKQIVETGGIKCKNKGSKRRERGKGGPKG